MENDKMTVEARLPGKEDLARPLKERLAKDVSRDWHMCMMKSVEYRVLASSMKGMDMEAAFRKVADDFKKAADDLASELIWGESPELKGPMEDVERIMGDLETLLNRDEKE